MKKDKQFNDSSCNEKVVILKTLLQKITTLRHYLYIYLFFIESKNPETLDLEYVRKIKEKTKEAYKDLTEFQKGFR